MKNYLKPFLSFKFLICFFSAWFITNGWAYVFTALGPVLHLKWMTTIGSSYLAVLWLPCTPEKLLTIPIAMWFNFKIFKDAKTHHDLLNMKAQAVQDLNKLFGPKKGFIKAPCLIRTKLYNLFTFILQFTCIPLVIVLYYI